MHKGKLLGLITMLAFMLTSCIKSYEPVIQSQDAVKFVVTGQVVKGDAVQRVNISTTSPLSKPRYFPVTGCNVHIVDAKGNSYTATDMQDGNYETIIPESELVAGSSFKVDIVVPGGANIVSDFDQLHECPDVTSLYYRLDSLPTNNPQLVIHGIQFYTDLEAENTSSRYFRWEAIESWEYHSSFPIEWWYDGILHREVPPDYSRSICWRTALVSNIFTLSTKNLAQNKYSFFPLHFVDNVSSSRLVYGYSVLLRQYAVSEAAFVYWEKLRVNSGGQDGLYEKQPMVIKGNMHNITSPDQEILGFFGVAEVKSKRVFIKNVENLPSQFDPGCSIVGEEPRRTGLKGIPSTFYPAYLYATAYGFMLILLDNYCYDCLAAGGDTIKPVFWPD